ncbi:hypothetical protein B0H14DRAFT_2595459 [Mycena olivaceomarginata]|nr:hypothetical protein B0H14DRAFT_2595459 [Mycena olivaceomarginata]
MTVPVRWWPFCLADFAALAPRIILTAALNGIHLLEEDDQVIETLHIIEINLATQLGPNHEGFFIIAMPVHSRSGSRIDIEKTVPPTAVKINTPPAEVPNSMVDLVAPKAMTLNSPQFGSPTSPTPGMMLQAWQIALTIADVHWLSTLICTWPVPIPGPPQHDDNILWDFTCHFVNWRDDHPRRRRGEAAGCFILISLFFFFKTH